MKEKFFYYQGQYYPMQSVFFRITFIDHDPEMDKYIVSMFHGSSTEAIAIFRDDEAVRVTNFLDGMAIDLELLD